MIVGQVSDDGVPCISLRIGDRDWKAIVDSGFNGYAELPNVLLDVLDAELVGQITSMLAGGVLVDEDLYRVTLPFDGELRRVSVTFASVDSILIGTRL